MNVALILSGGVGKRFGAEVPKQYMKIKNRLVIDYVIDAALSAKDIDEIVLVMDLEYLDWIEEKNNKKIHPVGNGEERLYSIKNGLDYIAENYPECEKIIIMQAVSPLITSKIVDDYMEILDAYDVVTTAEKCVGEIFNIRSYERLDRNNFYFCQSPEAFWFEDLFKSIDVTGKYSELIYHYEGVPKIFYYLDFKHNIKLTYPEDLEYAEFLIEKQMGHIEKNNRYLG